jgi:hypothetical protein
MREIGEWLVYNKDSLIKDIEPYASMMPSLPIEDKVTSLLKALALSYQGVQHTPEDILIAFESDEIKAIIKTHYMREWMI